MLFYCLKYDISSDEVTLMLLSIDVDTCKSVWVEKRVEEKGKRTVSKASMKKSQLFQL